MAVLGSTYAQPLPEGVARHRKNVKEMASAAKSRRQAKARAKRQTKEN